MVWVETWHKSIQDSIGWQAAFERTSSPNHWCLTKLSINNVLSVWNILHMIWCFHYRTICSSNTQASDTDVMNWFMCNIGLFLLILSHTNLGHVADLLVSHCYPVAGNGLVTSISWLVWSHQFEMALPNCALPNCAYTILYSYSESHCMKPCWIFHTRYWPMISSIKLTLVLVLWQNRWNPRIFIYNEYKNISLYQEM